MGRGSPVLCLLALGCGADEPAAPRLDAPVAAAEPVARADDGDDEWLARYPSLAYYPARSPELLAGLRTGAAREILRGLATSWAGAGFAGTEEWERLAHIRLAAPSGFARTQAGEAVPLPSGRSDLGCLGGFLEGVRMLWLPTLELAELTACEPPGGFETCDAGAHAGRAALLQIAGRLPPEALPGGVTLAELRVGRGSPETLLAALGPEPLHLCTVSHRSRARDGARMFHHMMIVDAALDRLGRLRVFDTTGRAGVAYRAMSRERLQRYVRDLLARSDAFRYDPDSAQLTCLAVARPERLRPDPKMR